MMGERGFRARRWENTYNRRYKDAVHNDVEDTQEPSLIGGHSASAFRVDVFA